MSGSGPWWVERVASLLSPLELGAVELGALWRLHERLRFVRDNVEAALLAIDCERAPALGAVWQQFLMREREVRGVLDVCREAVCRKISTGALAPQVFREIWQGLGYRPNEGDAGTPADDYLEGLFFGGADATASTTTAEDAALSSLGNPNIGSRAQLVAEFLGATEPARDDVVFDLGAGSGKLALTVSASTTSRVVGVEYCSAHVDASRRSAATLSLANLRLDHADVRDVDLSEGSLFYLYHPFRGAMARQVAERLGALARQKAIRIFTSGPLLGYGEYFLREVEKGALALVARKGKSSRALVLHSLSIPGSVDLATR